ncbi:hypothetical protein LIER_16540 [Lithospermum erythrorhizon]|uniref:Uncharacterized protein n=1 Tax=Lithospermum erythrorhizon TaxID=34254 RepID=A0AAV3Q7C3_LITER
MDELVGEILVAFDPVEVGVANGPQESVDNCGIRDGPHGSMDIMVSVNDGGNQNIHGRSLRIRRLEFAVQIPYILID